MQNLNHFALFNSLYIIEEKSSEYNEKNGNLASITYGNGLVEEYVYNFLDLVSEIWYTKDGIRTLDLRAF